MNVFDMPEGDLRDEATEAIREIMNPIDLDGSPDAEIKSALEELLHRNGRDDIGPDAVMVIGDWHDIEGYPAHYALAALLADAARESHAQLILVGEDTSKGSEELFDVVELPLSPSRDNLVQEIADCVIGMITEEQVLIDPGQLESACVKRIYEYLLLSETHAGLTYDNVRASVLVHHFSDIGLICHIMVVWPNAKGHPHNRLTAAINFGFDNRSTADDEVPDNDDGQDKDDESDSDNDDDD